MTGLIYPVPRHPDGRAPKISSGYRTSDRPTHKGVDIMYRRVDSDGGPPNGGQLPSHSRRHFMPSGLPALCIAPGSVKISKEIGTGGYVVVDHGAGLTSQYMHLFNRRVAVGQSVRAGQVLGEIGFNPSGFKLIHLHFQLRQDGELLDPRGPLKAMSIIEAPASSRLWIGVAASVAVGLAAARFVFR